MWKTVMTTVLALATVNANYTLTPITSNVIIEDIAKVHLFHETWNLIIGINFTSNQGRLASIDTTITLAESACNRKCTPQYELQLIRSRYNRLLHKNLILSKLLGKPTRQRRGLANFVGDISKTLFGTLTESDMASINNEFDKIYHDNKNVATVLSNHTKILKLILDSSSVNHRDLMSNQNLEREMARNLSNGLNAVSRDSFVNSKLLIAAIMIDETSEDIDTAINSINDGKHGIIHPQILTPAMLKETLKEFETTQRTRYHFDTEESNYQHIIGISQLSVAIVKGLFTYILKIPILEQEEGTIKHILPIPHLIQNLYFSIIPDHDYVIKYRDSYVSIDKDAINKCTVIDEYKICERNQPNVRLTTSDTCEATIFKRYEETKCKSSPFVLHKETFVPTTNGYLVIPLRQTSLDISCENRITNEIIKQPTLLTGFNCKVYNDQDILYLKENQKQSFREEFNITYPIKYPREDLLALEKKLIQLPKLIDNHELQQARLSLNDAESMINSIAIDRRTKTWQKIASDWASYLGYAALALGILYTLYRVGLFTTLANCLPKKICIFCVKTKVTTPTNIVTYTPALKPLITPEIKNRRVRI